MPDAQLRTGQSPASSDWLEDLLADPITAQLVGTRADIFSTKWRRCFGYLGAADQLHWYTLPFSSGGIARNFTWDNAKSLIWPAMWGPYWFAYRKLYGPAVAIAILCLLLVQLPPQWILPATFATMAFLLHYAPAIYLCHVRDAVFRLRSLSADDQARELASKQKPTSWVAVVVLVVGYAAISFGTEAIFGDGASGGVSACNSGRIKTLILNGTFTEPRAQAVRKIESGEVKLVTSAVDPRSITVNINNIRQIAYDPNTKQRRCVADYAVDAPVTEQTAGLLRTFGARPDQLVSLFVLGWRNNGVQFSICNGEIFYAIQATLDGGANNERVGWRCVPRNR